MEHHWKLLGGRVLKVKILAAKYDDKLEFPGEEGGVQNKTPSMEGDGCFVELHIKNCKF